VDGAAVRLAADDHVRAGSDAVAVTAIDCRPSQPRSLRYSRSYCGVPFQHAEASAELHGTWWNNRPLGPRIET
jgi:hypothetical protein